MNYRYSAYGLTLAVPFPCPALPVASLGTPADITVREGIVARDLPQRVAGDHSWQAAPGVYLCKGGVRSGRFLVENGTSVTVQRNPNADDSMLQFHFVHSVLAALLRQRGFLVLHANAAVSVNAAGRKGGAIAITGESGAGKSTTLAALVSKGCSMVSDDITALRLSETGTLEVMPGVPQIHLCEDAAARLKQDISGLPLYQWRRRKAAVPVKDGRQEAPAVLNAIYLLKKHTGSEVRVRPLAGVERFSALQSSIYGPLLPEEHPAHFPAMAALAERVAVYSLERPEDRWSVDDVSEVMLRG